MDERELKLEVKDLNISFKTDHGVLKAVRGVSFDLYKGETLCIVGESGSGKSVTSKAIMGILANNAIVESGSIMYEGENLLEVSEEEFHRIRGLKIGMIFQDPLSSLNPIMRIGKQITEATLINSDKLKQKYNDLISKELVAYKNVLAYMCITKRKYEAEYENFAAEAKKRMEETEDKAVKAQINAEVKAKRKEIDEKISLMMKESKAKLPALKAALKARKKEAKAEVNAYKNTVVEEYDNRMKELNKKYGMVAVSMDDATENTSYYKEIWKQLIAIQAISSSIAENTYKLNQEYEAFEAQAMKRIDAEEAKLEVEFSSKDEASRVKAEVNDQVAKIKAEIKAKKAETKQAISQVSNIEKAKLPELKAQLKKSVMEAEQNEKGSGNKAVADYNAKLAELQKAVSVEMDEANTAKIDKLKITRKEAKRRAIEIMTEVGIPLPEKRFKQYPFEFSGGMRQRIVIAIALTAMPDILICDEPTTALDVTIQAQILELINRLKRERNLSCIFITHDLGVVANMADRVAVMYAGKIVEYGNVNEIFFEPKHPYTWALLSSIPDVDSKEKLEAIPGTPPDMIYPPKGDAFALRSKYAMKIDYEFEPPFFKVSDTHYAATWLLHPNAPKVEMPKIVSERIRIALENAKKDGEANE